MLFPENFCHWFAVGLLLHGAYSNNNLKTTFKTYNIISMNIHRVFQQ